MADKRVLLNSNNELVAEDPSTGNREPVPFDEIASKALNLPSGYTIDEDNGDLVIRDTDGSVSLRRPDGGKWSLGDIDVTNLLEIPQATEGDSAPSDRAIAVDPNSGDLLIGGSN